MRYIVNNLPAEGCTCCKSGQHSNKLYTNTHSLVCKYRTILREAISFIFVNDSSINDCLNIYNEFSRNKFLTMNSNLEFKQQNIKKELKVQNVTTN